MELVSVKVFTADGRGSVGSVLAGLEFVLKAKLFYPEKPMVANLSFGTPAVKSSSSSQPSALAQALSALVQAGVTVTASAGNDAGGSACDTSPAGSDDVITVGATNVNDQVAPYSNLGPCVDLFAPGDRITSAWRNSNFDRAVISGTSAAAAFAAGVVALLMERYPKSSPTQVKAYLQEFGEPDAIDGIPSGSDTVNLLLNMGALALT